MITPQPTRPLALSLAPGMGMGRVLVRAFGSVCPRGRPSGGLTYHEPACRLSMRESRAPRPALHRGDVLSLPHGEQSPMRLSPVSTFHGELQLAVPFFVGIVGRLLVEFSWWMAVRKKFHYDCQRRESTWIDAGE